MVLNNGTVPTGHIACTTLTVVEVSRGWQCQRYQSARVEFSIEASSLSCIEPQGKLIEHSNVAVTLFSTHGANEHLQTCIMAV